MDVSVWYSSILIKHSKFIVYRINFACNDQLYLFADISKQFISCTILDNDIDKSVLKLEYDENKDKYHSEFERIFDVLDQIINIDLLITKAEIDNFIKIDVDNVDFVADLPIITFHYNECGSLSFNLFNGEIIYNDKINVKYEQENVIDDVLMLANCLVKFGFDGLMTKHEIPDDFEQYKMISSLNTLEFICKSIYVCYKQFHSKLNEIVSLNNKSRFVKTKSANVFLH